MDTTAILAAIALAVTAIGAVGAAILSLHVGVKAFKWVRAALS